MAALEATTYRVNHGLTHFASSGKRLIFVKLTDSSLRAVEDFHGNKVWSAVNF